MLFQKKNVTIFVRCKVGNLVGAIVFFCVCLFLFERDGYCLSCLVLYSSFFRNWCVCVCIGLLCSFGFEEFEFVCGFVFFVDRYDLFCTKKLLQIDPQAMIPETLHATGAKKFSKQKLPTILTVSFVHVL